MIIVMEKKCIWKGTCFLSTQDKITHDRVLNQLTDRAKTINIKFDQDKLQYKRNEIKYIAHIFIELRFNPDPEQG